MDIPPDCFDLLVQAPDVFISLCKEYYRIEPERLANALLWTFCLAPPRDLTLVASAAHKEFDDLAVPESFGSGTV